MKNIPLHGKTYCSEYVIDETRSLEWDREQVFSSNDFQMLVELPKIFGQTVIVYP